MIQQTAEQVEAAAEAAHYAQGFDDWEVANETERGFALEIAIAVLEAVNFRAPEPEWEWEYAPGHIDNNRDGEAFVQGSTIAPGYVQQYVAQGGSALKRKVSPWLPVEGESK